MGCGHDYNSTQHSLVSCEEYIEISVIYKGFCDITDGVVLYNLTLHIQQMLRIELKNFSKKRGCYGHCFIVGI